MSLTPGARLGPYEVISPIGEGGMGQVYRATDTNLKRQVAIKVLPPSVAGVADRLARFQREAEVLAALNHPNIAAIYGLEKTADVTALVMELVEGDDLSQRTARGAIPLEEALSIAKQIAEALEAAHEQGIIHRDLKPANIKVRRDGTVKVLDFGLAKAMEPAAGSSPNPSMSPTITTPAMTQLGMILGTAAYMSPEQARGKTVDTRADIWAFGAVLFEMLTGTRAFPGEDVGDTLATVVKLDPTWDAVSAEVPARVRQVLRVCLQKDPRQRAQAMGDVRLALEGAFETAASPASAPLPGASRGARLAWTVAAAAGLATAALAIPAVRYLRETPLSETRVADLSMNVAPADRLGLAQYYARPSRTAIAIAPNGATIVFGGDSTAPDGAHTTMLYRRPLAAAQSAVIPGTEGAEYPFFSPDGQWVGFGTGNKLKKVALSGGPPIDLCDFTFAGRIQGASWGPRGIIAFARRGLWTVSDSGGRPEALVESAATTDRAVLVSPTMLPDGQTVLFTEDASYKWEDAHIDAINVTTRRRTTLLTNAADARYSSTGHLVFVRNAALLAVPFDASRVAITGAQVPLLAGIMQSTNAPNGSDETGMGQFALSASGVLIYASGDRYPTPTSTVVRVDRKGGVTALAETKGDLFGLRLSPSGARVVAFKTNDGSRAQDIWMYDLVSGAPTRLTATGDASWPQFSQDGTSLTFASGGGNLGMYALSLNAGSAPQRLIEGTPGLVAASLSPDGKWLAYLQTVGNARQIFVRPIRDTKPDAGEPRQFSPSAFRQEGAEFSPDSRWIAYSSYESGSSEVYVQPFPGPGEKHRISANGGGNPAWSRNGRELFYLAPSRGADRPMMAVDISTTGDFKAGVPHQLFEGPYIGSIPLRSYDVGLDGQFVMNRTQRAPDEPVTTIHVVLGWARELKTRAPSGR